MLGNVIGCNRGVGGAAPRTARHPPLAAGGPVRRRAPRRGARRGSFARRSELLGPCFLWCWAPPDRQRQFTLPARRCAARRDGEREGYAKVDIMSERGMQKQIL